MVTNYEGENIEFKENLPLLPIRDLVVYPFMILPLFVGRESSIQSVEHSLAKTDRLILLSSQKDINAESPRTNEIFQVGTVAMIMRMRKLPDGRIKILVQVAQVKQESSVTIKKDHFLKSTSRKFRTFKFKKKMSRQQL